MIVFKIIPLHDMSINLGHSKKYHKDYIHEKIHKKYPVAETNTNFSSLNLNTNNIFYRYIYIYRKTGQTA